MSARVRPATRRAGAVAAVAVLAILVAGCGTSGGAKTAEPGSGATSTTTRAPKPTTTTTRPLNTTTSVDNLYAELQKEIERSCQAAVDVNSAEPKPVWQPYWSAVSTEEKLLDAARRCVDTEIERQHPTVTVTGHGDDVVDVSRPDDTNLTLVYAKHVGTANFIIRTPQQLMVNTIGNYEGVTLLGDTETNVLEVMADGDWTIQFRSMGKVQRYTGQPIELTGDNVLLNTTNGGATRFSYRGEGNFIVNEETGDDTNLAINTIGIYDGNVLLQGFPAFLIVTADGPWSIGPKV